MFYRLAMLKRFMRKTPQGYIDFRKPEDLLDFILRHHIDMKVPDQRYERGLPLQPGVPCPKCTYRDLGGQAYEKGKTPIGLSFVAPKDTCDSLIQKSGKHPVASIHTPGIIVFIAFNAANGPAILSYLVDGTHRAVAALRAGRDFFAHVLTPGETRQCMSLIDGKPNPHFIGQQGGVLWDGRGPFNPLPR
jgi:hypothetical protein